jgi:hypothetical protein
MPIRVSFARRRNVSATSFSVDCMICFFKTCTYKLLTTHKETGFGLDGHLG